MLTYDFLYIALISWMCATLHVRSCLDWRRKKRVGSDLSFGAVARPGRISVSVFPFYLDLMPSSPGWCLVVAARRYSDNIPAGDKSYKAEGAFYPRTCIAEKSITGRLLPEGFVGRL